MQPQAPKQLQTHRSDSLLCTSGGGMRFSGGGTTGRSGAAMAVTADRRRRHGPRQAALCGFVVTA